MSSPNRPPRRPAQRSPRRSPWRPAAARRWDLGLSPIAVLGLALLAVPRVVLHDLHVIEEGTPVNAAFVFVPPLVWIAVVRWRRAANPFRTLLVVGLVHGVLLALVHQVLWERNFGDDPPALGGNLSDLDPTAQTVILRIFAVPSSVFTGVLVGAVSGLAAWGLAHLAASARRDRP